MADAFRVLLTMEVAEGREQEFEEQWLKVGKVVSEHPDNLGQWFARSSERPHEFMIISDWPDEETFRRFEKEPGHWELTGQLRQLRVSGGMSTWQVLHYLPGAGAA
jgi:heme-degrading monooxygenase HmoA